jgi:hypothetical protein
MPDENDYREGDAVVYVNDLYPSSGLNLSRAYPTNVHLSGVEVALSGRFDDYTYY